MPRWGGRIGIDFQDIYYYLKPTAGQGKTWDDVPHLDQKAKDELWPHYSAMMSRAKQKGRNLCELYSERTAEPERNISAIKPKRANGK